MSAADKILLTSKPTSPRRRENGWVPLAFSATAKPSSPARMNVDQMKKRLRGQAERLRLRIKKGNQNKRRSFNNRPCLFWRRFAPENIGSSSALGRFNGRPRRLPGGEWRWRHCGFWLYNPPTLLDARFLWAEAHSFPRVFIVDFRRFGSLARGRRFAPSSNASAKRAGFDK